MSIPREKERYSVMVVDDEGMSSVCNGESASGGTITSGGRFVVNLSVLCGDGGGGSGIVSESGWWCKERVIL